MIVILLVIKKKDNRNWDVQNDGGNDIVTRLRMKMMKAITKTIIMMTIFSIHI